MPEVLLPVPGQGPLYAGLFVAFEGGEGAGKSSHAAALYDRLAAAGLDVVRTREPGGTPNAEAIRGILLTAHADPDRAPLTARAEALLFAAARAEHVAAVVLPALQRGAVVITDRYLDSSIAYQGVGRGLGADVVGGLNGWATEGLFPDLTVLLDIDPAVGLRRVADANRMEAEPLEFHQRVRAGFLDLAGADPERYLVVDAGAPRPEVSAAVAARVEELLHSRRLEAEVG